MNSKHELFPFCLSQWRNVQCWCWEKASASKKTEEAVTSVNSGRPHPAVTWLTMATALVCPPPLSLRRPLNIHTHSYDKDTRPNRLTLKAPQSALSSHWEQQKPLVQLHSLALWLLHRCAASCGETGPWLSVRQADSSCAPLFTTGGIATAASPLGNVLHLQLHHWESIWGLIGWTVWCHYKTTSRGFAQLTFQRLSMRREVKKKKQRPSQFEPGTLERANCREELSGKLCKSCTVYVIDTLGKCFQQEFIYDSRPILLSGKKITSAEKKMWAVKSNHLHPNKVPSIYVKGH